MATLRRIVGSLLGFLLGIAIVGIIVSIGVFGREGTVFGVADRLPEALRRPGAEAMLAVTQPASWIEQGLNVRFGGVAHLSDLNKCLGADRTQGLLDSCARSHEEYLPQPVDKATYAGRLETASCVIDVTFDPRRSVPTQLGVILDAKNARTFGVANIRISSADLKQTSTVLGYQVDDAGCAFIRAHPDCEWTLLSVKGFQNDLGKS